MHNAVTMSIEALNSLKLLWFFKIKPNGDKVKVNVEFISNETKKKE